MRFLSVNILILLFCGAALAQPSKILNKKQSLRIDLKILPNNGAVNYEISSISKLSVGGTGIFNGLNPTHGQFRFSLYSFKDNVLIYQDGFSSLFEEWESSEYDGKSDMPFEHSLTMPLPMVDVKFVLERRNSLGDFEVVHNQEIIISELKKNSTGLKGDILKIVKNGDAHKKVDVAIVGDGYTLQERSKFEADARRFANYFLTTEPFASHASYFNISSVFIPSQESGCIVPVKGLHPSTLLGSSFSTFGSDRYLETFNAFTLADCLFGVAHDLVVVLVNVEKYGGGGVFNYFANGSAGNSQSMAVMLHEIGHSFAGLADEYYDSEVAYSDFHSKDIEPWESNITTLVDFASKWESRMGEEGVELVEGGGYAAKGIYRSSENCMMKELRYPFCKVCQRVIIERIKLCAGEK